MTGVAAGATEATRSMSLERAVLASVTHTQRGLQRVTRLRALLIGVAAGIATLIVGVVAAPAIAVPLIAAFVVAILVSGIVAFVALRRSPNIDDVRSALWMEERLPAGYALVTLAEQHTATNMPALPPESRERLVQGVVTAVGGVAHMDADMAAAVQQLARRKLQNPTLFILASASILAWSLLARSIPRLGGLTGRDGKDALVGGADARNASIGAWRVRVVPPDYSGLRAMQYADTDNVVVLAGSTIEIQGGGDVLPAVQANRVAHVGNDSGTNAGILGRVVVEASPSGWTARLIAEPSPLEVRVTRGNSKRLLLIEGFADSLPRVSLERPARDSVLRTAVGSFPLAATLHDDLGLRAGAFELIVSSGEGERFTAKTVRIGATQFGSASNSTAHSATIRAALNLDSLHLGPGDIVHMRAVARDANPERNREWGSSETRSIRIARPAEYDSVSVEPAPPPEVDKSLMSERMLLMLTERLEARRPRISVSVLHDEALKLAQEQARLRLAVGDAVFQRLSGEASAEDSHADDDRHIDTVGGKLAMSTGMSEKGMLEEGDDSPVIAVNKPLLEAYNAMWDAGRALEQSDLRAAIPHMRVALAAIERARAASRLYLRGRPPVVILDLAKIRLAGKDTGVTNARSIREALTPAARIREGRLLAAAVIAVEHPEAARDSVALMRIEAMGDAPLYTDALLAVLDVLKRGGDATPAFIRARRALGGVTRAPNSAWSRVGAP